MNAEKLNAAVQAFLDDCHDSERPLDCFVLQATRLRQNPEWTESEVLEFETVALRMLAAIVTR